MIAFDLEDVVTTEFGLGREGDGPSIAFGMVPMDAGVRSALLSMARLTMRRMESAEDGGAEYDPAEKHGGTEYLVVPAGGSLDAGIRELHEAENLSADRSRLEEPEGILSYFARFTDGEDRRLTAIRRAGHFKGVLKNRLASFRDDRLRIVEDDVFKLDNDFDVLLDASFTHIWRPAAFEFVSRLQQAILDAVPSNVGVIAAELPFVELEGIESYAESRPRAARYLASIRSQRLAGMDRDALLELCGRTGVGVREVNGRVAVERGHEMAFLEVLDRRRYRVELVPGRPERFRAPSRQTLDGVGSRSARRGVRGA